MTDTAPVRSALKPGEVAIIVDEQNVTVFVAEGDDDKRMSMLGLSIVEAAVRCAIEPGFAQKCIAKGSERRKNAH